MVEGPTNLMNGMGSTRATLRIGGFVPKNARTVVTARTAVETHRFDLAEEEQNGGHWKLRSIPKHCWLQVDDVTVGWSELLFVRERGAARPFRGYHLNLPPRPAQHYRLRDAENRPVLAKTHMDAAGGYWTRYGPKERNHAGIVYAKGYAPKLIPKAATPEIIRMHPAARLRVRLKVKRTEIDGKARVEIGATDDNPTLSKWLERALSAFRVRTLALESRRRVPLADMWDEVIYESGDLPAGEIIIKVDGRIARP